MLHQRALSALVGEYSNIFIFSSNVNPMSVVLSGIGCPFFEGFCVLNLPHKLTGIQLDFRPIKVSVANTGARLHVTAIKIHNLL